MPLNMLSTLVHLEDLNLRCTVASPDGHFPRRSSSVLFMPPTAFRKGLSQSLAGDPGKMGTVFFWGDELRSNLYILLELLPVEM